MADTEIPEGLTADYENLDVQNALEALTKDPDWERLAEFLRTLGTGYLVVDVTGTNKKKATRVRTVRSTTGELVLPLFTSMAEVRRAVPKRQQDTVRGAIMPALEALRLVESDRFVAAQVNPGGSALVVKREFIERILSGDDITPESLQH